MSKKPRKLGGVSTTTSPSEQARVEAWRTSAALKLGFRPARAFEVALLPLDMHELEHLVMSGCPLETAVAILS